MSLVLEDPTDPQAVEERSRSEQENYKVYKRRWLVLFAMFVITFNVGLFRCLIPIVDVLRGFLDISMDKYNLMTQVSMYSNLLSVFPLARALDLYGLRRVSYLACLIVVLANGLKALTFNNLETFSGLTNDTRFYILVTSEIFNGMSQSIAFCVPAKVAGVWFAHYESTLAIVIVNCGFNLGFALGNYFSPIYVETVGDMSKLSYMFSITGIVVVLTVLSCVTRSSPKIPPSSSATNDPNSVPLLTGLRVMLSFPSYVLVLTALNTNIAVMAVQQFELEDVLRSKQYSDSFCGVLVAQIYFFGVFFMLMGATWIDNSSNYVRVSRIAAMLCSISIAFFSMSIILPNIRNIIITANILTSFGSSILYPALLQVSIRTASPVLPEASVSALVIVAQQVFSALLLLVIGPLKGLSGGGYEAPMIIFAVFNLITSLIYTTSFRPPKREQLHKKLAEVDREPLIEEDNV